MDKFNADLVEIFGSGPDFEPSQKGVPELPMETLEWELRNAPTGAADALVRKAELAEFLNGIVGADYACFAKTPKAAPVAEFTKRAASKLLTRQAIAKRLTPYYRHGVWKRWEAVMDAFVGTAEAEFDERAAREFLEAA